MHKCMELEKDLFCLFMYKKFTRSLFFAHTQPKVVVLVEGWLHCKCWFKNSRLLFLVIPWSLTHTFSIAVLFSINMAKGERARKLAWVKISRASLEVTRGSSAHIPLSGMQSHSHTELQGRMPNAVCVPRIRGNRFKEDLASLSHFFSSAYHLIDTVNVCWVNKWTVLFCFDFFLIVMLSFFFSLKKKQIFVVNIEIIQKCATSVLFLYYGWMWSSLTSIGRVR